MFIVYIRCVRRILLLLILVYDYYDDDMYHTIIILILYKNRNIYFYFKHIKYFLIKFQTRSSFFIFLINYLFVGYFTKLNVETHFSKS